MKDSQKVYIRGDANRSREVIKTLEDLGGINYNNLNGSYADLYYYISPLGRIEYVANYEHVLLSFIKEFYKEIKLPEQWKEGDILYNEINKEFAVVKCKCKFDSDVVVTYFVTCYGTYLTNKSLYTGNFRLATKSEITQLHEHLHAIGKDWDAENKKLVNWKWKPKEGDDYWTVIVGIANKLKLTWFGTKADEARYKLGNCFKTREEAEVMAEKVKNLFLQNHEKTKENS